MVTPPPTRFIAVLPALAISAGAVAQDVGSIRGIVNDRDFEQPLALAQVQIIETGQRVTASEQGDYAFSDLPPGTYTLVFSKDGYQRQVRTDVLVTAGQLSDVDAFLSGDFTDMEEFVVQDVQLDAGTESALLQLRLDSPGLLDSISAELISQAGASDAAGALNLIAGASVQDGKYATVRGLPDRYVQTLLNGVRLPTSDEDKRAVQLDLFPSAVIESIQVTKSFTPDQQGDASGGGVNIVLKGIPDENILRFKTEYKWNSQVRGRDDFLTYRGGGVNTWGDDGGQRDIPAVKNPDADPSQWIYDFDGQAVGTELGLAPQMYKWSADLGLRHEFDDGLVIGGFASFFYERDAAYTDNGIDDTWVAQGPGAANDPTFWTPQISGQDGQPVPGNDFQTSFFDVTEGVESLQWGGLLTGGLAWGGQEINVAYLYTRTTEDRAVLAEDTRGKQWFMDQYYPDSGPYDPYDVTNPGNSRDNLFAAPYQRTQTLNYIERTVQSLQLSGNHVFEFEERAPAIPDVITFTGVEFDWNLSNNKARQYEPDKVQFGSRWLPPASAQAIPGFPFYINTSGQYIQLLPGPNINLGNIQHVYKDIEEQNRQYQGNLTLPFEQWSGDDGYLKFGFFNDKLHRTYDQETFANYRGAGDPLAAWPSPDYPYYNGSTGQTDPPIQGDPDLFPDGPGWDEYWSTIAPYQGFNITDGGALNRDVDYVGDQRIAAYYAMADVPIFTGLNVIGGFRFETTDISIVNEPGPVAEWFPPGATAPVQLNPGDADVDYSQFDMLPSAALVVTPDPTLILRAAYSQTVARQTFKELSPILQQEYLGGPIFIGNPSLAMSSLINYDLRADWTPYDGGLFSASWFRKELTDPIEYVSRGTPAFGFTTPENYPAGRLEGFEFEARQNLGDLVEGLRAITLGGNATFINSRVDVSDADQERFLDPAIDVSITSRDMTGAPKYLYNLYATVGLEETGTNLGLFWTAQGDTLVAGAGVNGDNEFIPSTYSLPVGTLNFTVTQQIFKNFQLFFKAKNITNPEIQTVWRSPDGDSERIRTSYTSGVDISVGITASFTF